MIQYEKRIEKSFSTIHKLFTNMLQEKTPSNLYIKYKTTLELMIRKEINPLLMDIIKKNEEKLKIFYKENEQKNNSEEEKQLEFNKKINSFLTFLVEVKLMKKVYQIQKDAIHYIKYNENDNTSKKESKQITKILNKYQINLI